MTCHSLSRKCQDTSHIEYDKFFGHFFSNGTLLCGFFFNYLFFLCPYTVSFVVRIIKNRVVLQRQWMFQQEYEWNNAITNKNSISKSFHSQHQQNHKKSTSNTTAKQQIWKVETPNLNPASSTWKVTGISFSHMESVMLVWENSVPRSVLQSCSITSHTTFSHFPPALRCHGVLFLFIKNTLLSFHVFFFFILFCCRLPALSFAMSDRHFWQI